MNKVIEKDVLSIVEEPLNWKELKNKTVLITGATGMVGQSIVFTLMELNKKMDINVKILVLCRGRKVAEQLFKEQLDKNVFIIVQDVIEKLKYDNQIDYIIHCASPSHPAYFMEDPVGTIDANTLGTKNTLEVAKEKNSQYCYISTMEIYGEMNEVTDITEDKFGAIDSLQLRSSYPLSKKLGENLCLAYKLQYNVDCKIVRLAHTYGPGMNINDSRVQCELIREVINNEDIVLKSDGTMKRTYTYISDVISGIFYIILSGNELVYNVANEEAIISIKELANTIIKAKANSKSKLVFKLKDEKGWYKVAPKIMNCSRLKSLGWKPRVDVAEGMKRSIDYFENE